MNVNALKWKRNNRDIKGHIFFCTISHPLRCYMYSIVLWCSSKTLHCCPWRICFFFSQAGVDHKIDLRIQPALKTLGTVLFMFSEVIVVHEGSGWGYTITISEAKGGNDQSEVHCCFLIMPKGYTWGGLYIFQHNIRDIIKGQLHAMWEAWGNKSSPGDLLYLGCCEQACLE